MEAITAAVSLNLGAKKWWCSLFNKTDQMKIIQLERVLDKQVLIEHVKWQRASARQLKKTSERTR